MYVPITGITTFFGAIVMLVAWWFVGARIRRSQSAVSQPVKLLNKFFFQLFLFFIIMAAPHVLVTFDPTEFPLPMGIAYVVGHVFLYYGCVHVVRLTCELVPKLKPRVRLLTTLALAGGIAITIANAFTVAYGERPAFDYANNVTLFNTQTAVGAAIGLFLVSTVVPATILFIRNAFKATGPRRLRSALLGSGLLILMTAGPLHDNATTGQIYLVADVLSIFSIILLGAGVLYRLEDSLAVAPSRPRVIVPSSNTV